MCVIWKRIYRMCIMGLCYSYSSGILRDQRLHVSQRNLSYHELRRLVEKLEVLCRM